MSTFSANSSRVGLRMRPDLIVRRQQLAGRQVWIVKDPVALRYFTLSAQEFAILRWVDEAPSLDDLRRNFEAEFPPQRVSTQQLQSFLSKLHERGLLLAVGPENGQRLLERDTRQRHRERWQNWANVLAIRFRGLDPKRGLDWVYPKLRWCFTKWFLSACIFSMVAALAIIFVHAAEFRRQLPELHTLLQPDNLFWMIVAFAAVKILHELGHALTCKHFGGECHEIGVLLLLFVPTLYCNVTDSWIFRSRWQRIAVSAAGILVEVQLAAIAVLVWWHTQPGLVHTIALNTVIVCSVGTVLFNGNPLLRYDGYFVLAEMLETPNLWQESRVELKRILWKWFLADTATPPTKAEDRRLILVIYGLASVVYRVFLSFAILLFMYRLLTPRGFGVLVPIVAASLVGTAIVLFIGATWRFWQRPLAWRLFRPARLVAAVCLAAIVLWGFLAVQLPCRIDGTSRLQPATAQRIYVATPGTLEKSVLAGDSVDEGQVLAQLDDPLLRREIERLAGDANVAQTRVGNLEIRLNDDPDIAAQLEVAREMLAEVRQQLAQRQLEAKSLELVSPIAGIAMEPPDQPAIRDATANLPAWKGTPLDQQNRHCFLERGTLVCLVGDPTRLDADVTIDENDVQYVRVGQRVRLQFSITPTAVLTGRVQEISKRDVAKGYDDLATEQKPADDKDTNQLLVAGRAFYSIRVALEDCREHLLAGAVGRAKIEVAPQTLADRTLRALRRVFTLPM